MAEKRCATAGCRMYGCGDDGLCNKHHWERVYDEFVDERRSEGQTLEDIAWTFGAAVHLQAAQEAEIEEEEKELARLKRKKAKSAAAGK